MKVEPSYISRNRNTNTFESPYIIQMQVSFSVKHDNNHTDLYKTISSYLTKELSDGNNQLLVFYYRTVETNDENIIYFKVKITFDNDNYIHQLNEFIKNHSVVVNLFRYGHNNIIDLIPDLVNCNYVFTHDAKVRKYKYYGYAELDCDVDDLLQFSSKTDIKIYKTNVNSHDYSIFDYDFGRNGLICLDSSNYPVFNYIIKDSRIFHYLRMKYKIIESNKLFYYPYSGVSPYPVGNGIGFIKFK